MCASAGELRLLLVRARLWEDTCLALEAAAGQPSSNTAVPRILGFSRTHGIGSASTAGSRATSTAGTGALSASDLADLSSEMEYVTPEALAAADSSDATSSSDWQMALGGMCPVSVASSSCAAAAGGAAVPGRLPLGKLADSSLGCIRYTHGDCLQA